MEQRSRFHGYAYDGIWALALALHNASNFYKGGSAKNKKYFLSTFRYHDVFWENAILESLEATSFMGVTVRKSKAASANQKISELLYCRALFDSKIMVARVQF